MASTDTLTMSISELRKKLQAIAEACRSANPGAWESFTLDRMAQTIRELSAEIDSAYQEGYEAGKQEGYNEGYEAGRQEGSGE